VSHSDKENVDVSERIKGITWRSFYVEKIKAQQWMLHIGFLFFCQATKDLGESNGIIK